MDNGNISLLHTEQRNPETRGIDQLSTLEMLNKINHEDMRVAAAVQQALPQIAAAVEMIVPRMLQGGRLVYVGAGTSGRLGYMDAAECRPTYGVAADTVSCVMAGGRNAVFSPQESLEDYPEQAWRDLQEWGLQSQDIVAAAAASGRTPYCIGALDYARSIGAGAVSISCNPDAEMSRHADVGIEVDTGAESIMGSTRMKAGTAQKMIMNMLSTAAMIKLGRTHDNLMICLRANNNKVSNRMIRLFREATGEQDDHLARKMIDEADGELDTALLMYQAGCGKLEARQALCRHVGFDKALEYLMHANQPETQKVSS